MKPTFVSTPPGYISLGRSGVGDIKVGVLPLVHDIFAKAYGGGRVVRGARLAGDRT